jgi:hypothetical protein
MVLDMRQVPTLAEGLRQLLVCVCVCVCVCMYIYAFINIF